VENAFRAQFRALIRAGSLTSVNGLRRRCEERLRGIRIPDPFDLDGFCDEVSARRGRPLIRRPVPGLSASAPCGLWIGTGEADHVFYDPGTSPLHAEHIVLHEVAHILSGHAGPGLSRLFPDLDPAAVERVLGRSGYPTTQEREAEMMASLVADSGRTRAALRAYRSLVVLRPLWTAIRDAFPEIILVVPGRAAFERGGADNGQLRLYRRVIEIRDGMLALRPHLPASFAPGGDPAVAEARGIALALHRRAAGEPPEVNPGAWAPVGPDVPDEVAWLSRVSAAFGEPARGPAALTGPGVPLPRPCGSAR
jgi:hypothetical protein